MAVTMETDGERFETPKKILPKNLTNGLASKHGEIIVNSTEILDQPKEAVPFFLRPNGDLTATPSQGDSKDIAIVGMACRVAGGNNSPAQLWESLLNKRDASGEMPPDRWEPYHRRDPRNTKILNEISSRGYYLDKLEDFDAQFFGISPMEADQMDPQQRISLEVAYEALENAGIAPQSLSGSDTAVFWGINSGDYSHLVLEDMPNIEAWMGIGTSFCGSPNRISYHLNLLGPSSAVDAACASSLVAVHHGVQAILTGESEMAIVGGANALCGPGLFRALDRAGALSSDGCCRSFDDAACGYLRGEGAGAVVLKSVSKAIRDQDEILAVIKGTAVGHDGKTNGIMAPNSLAQARVARRALQVANIDPTSVGYVEAHATSTPLGDPTELAALASVYGEGRTDDPCLIGSVKPNIGHLEAGAGVMGLIKAVLAIQKGVIPSQANLQTLTKRFEWENSGLEVVQETKGWSNTARVRRAAVSSYGYGGTVSHAVIEQFVPAKRFNLHNNIDQKPSQPLLPTRPFTLLLSGRQEKRIASQAHALREWIESNKNGNSLASIASTLALRRDHHDYRAALIVQSQEEAVQALAQLAEKKNHPWVTQCRVLEPHVNKDVVWVFSGHGAQWHNMGKELLDLPSFYRAIEPLDRVVYQEIGVSPISLLRNCNFESSAHVQILTYIMQIGISAVLSSLGIFPKAIIGHSVGEIAASVVAGALTPEEGAIIVTRRAVLYGQVTGQGAMILVNESFHDTIEKLGGRTDVVAAIDTSPSSCVISGPTEAVVQVGEDFKKQGIKVFRVKTDIAFHSPMLNALEEPLIAALGVDVLPAAPTRAKLYSTCLQDPRGQDLRGPSYWADNMVSPVRLTSAVKAALDDGYRVFMEISSHPIVSQSINETMMDADVTEGLMLPTLLRDKPTEKSILRASAHLHCQGISIDWRRQTTGTWATDLPNAPWIHRPAGRKIETAPMSTAQTHTVESNTLLGGRIPVAGADTTLYTTKLDETNKPFPLSHPVHGTEIIPAACLLNTFFKATGMGVLENIVLRVPLATSAPRAVQIVKERNEIKVMSQLIQENQDTAEDSSSWVTHTTAKWDNSNSNIISREQHIDVEAIKASIQVRLQNDFTIDYLSKVGVSAMGFPWDVTEHWGTTQEMLARVVSDGPDTSKCSFSSDLTSWGSLLDAATSVGSTLFFDEPRLRMPAQVQRAEIFTKEAPPTSCWLYVQKASETPYTSHISLLNDAGQMLAKLTAMRFSEIEGAPDSANSMESLVHQISWVNAEPAKQQLSIKKVVILSNNAALREKYAGTVPEDIETIQLSSIHCLAAYHSDTPLKKETIVVYIPEEALSMHDIETTAQKSTWDVVELLKFNVQNSLPAKIFVLTCNVGEAQDSTALAHSPLVGLSRVLSSEHPDNFGGLIDNDVAAVPISNIQHSQEFDVMRIRNGQSTIARLQSLPHNRLLPSTQASQLLPRPEGTYLVTGGIGALGLQVAAFLVDKGARRLVLVSRRRLPPRKTWNQIEDNEMSNITARIRELEARGASIHVLALDISVPSAAQDLSDALQRLDWPPVLGVIHAAGVVDNQLALDAKQDAFNRVLAPKVTGGLVLHQVFPPGSVDFFILFSSCGQLVGFTGQSSYGSGNAFLDGLATYRRAQGDRAAVAVQWTSWRGLGMAASTEYINAELESKGISDVTSDEAFSAWMHLSKYDIDHGVVLRSLVFDEGEELPSPILADIAIRRLAPDTSTDNQTDTSSSDIHTLSSTELKSHLLTKISECVAQILHMDAEEIDHRAALSDLGIDSVMTVSVRRLIQQTLKVKMPPTLTWTHPTINHLVGWFTEKLLTTTTEQ